MDAFCKRVHARFKKNSSRCEQIVLGPSRFRVAEAPTLESIEHRASSIEHRVVLTYIYEQGGESKPYNSAGIH